MMPIEEVAVASREDFERDLRPRYRPFVIRGVAADWPLVAAGRLGGDQALALIEKHDSRVATEIMVAPPSAQGRFFYAPDMRGFNFQRQRGTLSQLARRLRVLAGDAEPPGVYAGAAAARSHLPGFAETHPFPLAGAQAGAMMRIWLGNATQVATHFDLSDNFAVVALGRRRFTLYPPETVSDLYVGPLDVTLAGQPVSMVDPLAPDLDTYPRFAKVQAHALIADLEPGDAIYIPTLWWHHVAATEPINALVNFWHNDASQGGGFLALIHAILAIRDQPEPQRGAWRAWFEHMVFSHDAPRSADHIPLNARGVAGPPSPDRDARMRGFIARVLSQR